MPADFFLHLFALTWAAIDQPLTQMTTEIAGRTIGAVRPGIAGAIILAFSLAAVSAAVRLEDVILSSLPLLVAAVLTVSTLLTLPFYTATIIHAWQTWPAQLVAAVTGAGHGNIPELLDLSMVKSVRGATEILEQNGGSLWSPTTWLIIIFAGLLILAAVGSHVVMFACFFALSLVGSLLVSTIGPMSVALFPFKRTQHFAMNFVAALGSVIVSIICLAATMTLVLGVESKIGQAILAIKGGGNGAVGHQLIGLCVGIAIYCLFAWLAKTSIQIARAVFGGIAVGMGNFIDAPANMWSQAQNAVAGSAGGGGARGGGGGSGGGGGGGGYEGARPIMPPGRPLGAFSRTHL